MKAKPKELIPGLEVHGLTLYLRTEKTLIFGDLHLGYEEELRKHGYLVPRFQYKEILSYLDEILSEVPVERAIINGDLKHEFGRISEQEWSEVMGFLRFLEERCNDIILIKGNHDNILGPIARKKKIKIRDYYFIKKKGIYVCHGHRIPEDDDFRSSRTIIIGHDHPAIALRDELRIERVKCFLKGEWNGKVLIQIPSLNFVTEGTDITAGKLLSPFLQQGIGEFEVYGIEGREVFDFGRLKGIYSTGHNFLDFCVYN